MSRPVPSHAPRGTCTTSARTSTPSSTPSRAPATSSSDPERGSETFMAGLEDLYREIILDHYKNPRLKGELPPPALRTEGFNPLCGDEVVVTVDVDDGTIRDLRFTGQGCSISQSSASMMAAAVKGRS